MVKQIVIFIVCLAALICISGCAAEKTQPDRPTETETAAVEISATKKAKTEITETDREIFKALDSFLNK